MVSVTIPPIARSEAALMDLSSRTRSSVPVMGSFLPCTFAVSLRLKRLYMSSHIISVATPAWAIRLDTSSACTSARLSRTACATAGVSGSFSNSVAKEATARTWASRLSSLNSPSLCSLPAIVNSIKSSSSTSLTPPSRLSMLSKLLSNSRSNCSSVLATPCLTAVGWRSNVNADCSTSKAAWIFPNRVSMLTVLGRCKRLRYFLGRSTLACASAKPIDARVALGLSKTKAMDPS